MKGIPVNIYFVLSTVLFLFSNDQRVLGLDNGLALTPPMGWMTWQRFRCTTDCTTYPNECISEQLIKRTVDAIVRDGYKEAGYEYVVIDDCWLEHERDPQTQRLVPDRKRFPNGMKAVGDYIHSKGLKFGLYEDYGTKTCAGYPGVIDHMELDANTFAEWGVDYVKLDGCYADPATMDEGYPQFGAYLNATNRPMVYSCSWPAYIEDDKNIKPDWPKIAKHCNLWRNSWDIDDSYEAMKNIADHFAKKQDEFLPNAGIGAWNDPDMLLIGNFGLSKVQAEMQMGIWAILAAPLLMSVDMDTIRPDDRAILLNKEAIAINQDRLGKQGRRIYDKGNLEVWIRFLDGDSVAVLLVNQNTDGMPRMIQFDPSSLGINKSKSYNVRNIFEADSKIPKYEPSSNKQLRFRVVVSGCVLLRFDADRGN